MLSIPITCRWMIHVIEWVIELCFPLSPVDKWYMSNYVKQVYVVRKRTVLLFILHLDNSTSKPRVWSRMGSGTGNPGKWRFSRKSGKIRKKWKIEKNGGFSGNPAKKARNVFGRVCAKSRFPLLWSSDFQKRGWKKPGFLHFFRNRDLKNWPETPPVFLLGHRNPP